MHEQRTMMDVKQSKLANGIRVLTAAMPGVQTVTFGIWVKVGSRYEPDRLAGISHFIEHLLFKGTRRRSASDITRAIEGRGGYLNAFTQEEATCYFARGTYERTSEIVDVLTDMYREPRFDPKEIDRERGVIVEEIMMYRDQPHQYVHELLGQALWQGHSAGRPVIGTVEAVQKVSRADIAGYKETHYVPNRSLFVFAGRVEHADCVELVRRLVPEGAGTRGARFGRVTGATRQRRVHFEQRPIEQSHLAIGFRLFGNGDDRRHALRLLNVILGENMSSRLFQVVRERNGLAYSIHSSAHMMADTGALVISAGLDRKRTGRAVALIAREIDRLKRKPVGREEFRRARDYVLGQMRIGLESSSSQMMWLGNSVLAHGRFISPEATVASIQRMTPEDLRALAVEYLTADKASLCLIGPGVSSAEETRIAASIDGL